MYNLLVTRKGITLLDRFWILITLGPAFRLTPQLSAEELAQVAWEKHQATSIFTSLSLIKNLLAYIFLFI